MTADSGRIGAIMAAMREGAPWWLALEAEASVAMSRDDDTQTWSLPDEHEYLTETPDDVDLSGLHDWETVNATVVDTLDIPAHLLSGPTSGEALAHVRQHRDEVFDRHQAAWTKVLGSAASPMPTRVRMSQATLDSLRAVSEPPTAPRYTFDGSLGTFTGVPIRVDPDLADGVIEPDYPGDTKTLPGEDQP